MAFSRQGSGPGHRPSFVLQDVLRPCHVTVSIQFPVVTPERIAIASHISTSTLGTLATRTGFAHFLHSDTTLTECQFYPLQ